MAVTQARSVGDAVRRAMGTDVLVVTAALLLGFQAIRVFTTHTVWLIGETSSREVLAIVVLGGFAAAILAWPIARAVGVKAARLWSLRLLAAGGGYWTDFRACLGSISEPAWLARLPWDGFWRCCHRSDRRRALVSVWRWRLISRSA